MHSYRQFRIPLLSLALAIAVLLVACQNPEPSARSIQPEMSSAELAEIVAKSRERSEAVESYATRTTSYRSIENHDPSPTKASQVDRVTSAIFVEPNEVHHREDVVYYDHEPMIITPDITYVSANTDSSRWKQSKYGLPFSQRLGSADILGLMFPEQFFYLQLARSDGNHYVIEGFGIFKEEAGLDDPYYGTDTEQPVNADRMQLKIRKSDYALVKLIRWDLPVAEVNKNDEITIMRLPSGLAHLRDVHEFSQIDEGISVEVPNLPAVLIGLDSFRPEDGAQHVGLHSEIYIELGESFELIDIQLDPPVPLLTVEPQFSWFNSSRFKPQRSFAPGTNYTATITWRDSEGGLHAHTWTFTTQHLS